MMTDKRIKNEQWTVRELIQQVQNQHISKPKFNRKKKWDIIRIKEIKPNIQDYIIFLYGTYNSVHAITFGEYTTDGNLSFSNIDGNNRINAIMHFMNKPFTIFPEYLKDLFKELDEIDNVDKIILQEIKDVFNNISYNDMISIKTPGKYFRTIGKTELYSNIQHKNDDFDDRIEEIQKLLKINDNSFDSYIKINVNLFERYTNDELCKTFEDINKFDNKLTEIELLACRLYHITNFTINDSIIKTQLQQTICEYYKEKSEGEVLKCYNYTDTEIINAYDFIVGFQNLCHNTYNFIEKTDYNGLSLFFKLYKTLYGLNETSYTTENVNDFIKYINYSCNILNGIIQSMFTTQLNDILFNKSCLIKLNLLKKNTLYMILISIIGFYKQNTDETIIKNSIAKCILYHFMISDVSDKDKKGYFKNFDTILYEAGGSYINNKTKQYLETPLTIVHDNIQNIFVELIDYLCLENNMPTERYMDDEKQKLKKEKRRKLQFWEKTLMFYYYKEHIPINMLENDFSLEHIIPNSSIWEGELDKDRLGNLTPIISLINSSRGNRHINFYKDSDQTGLCEFMKNIIPTNEVYDSIMNHDTRKAMLINNDAYNELCLKNQETYKNNFIQCIF